MNLNNEVVRFLSNGTTLRLMSFKNSIQNNTSQDAAEAFPNDFVFLFGQHSSDKSEVFNILKPESLINRFIDTTNENIRFLRVSLFYQDHEYLIT